MNYYDKKYFENGNYKDYTSGRYRFWHWTRYLAIGIWLKTLGYRRIIDFGCADGVSVAAFRMVGIEAWGCDVSKYAISMAPDLAKEYVWAGSIGEKKFPDQYFDLAVSFDVMEHIPEKELTNTIKGVMKLCKKALFGIYVEDELIARLHALIGKEHPDHLSSHETTWWRRLFGSMRCNLRHVILSRKGTFWVEPV